MVLQYEETHSLTDSHDKGITRVAFSPKGSWIATAGLDGRVVIWDAKSGTLKYVFAGTSPVLSLTWLPQGEELLICGLADGNIACLNIGGVSRPYAAQERALVLITYRRIHSRQTAFLRTVSRSNASQLKRIYWPPARVKRSRSGSGTLQVRHSQFCLCSDGK